MVFGKLSPSAADRWMACPGSVTLTKDAPYKPSQFAAEGTVAHYVVETAMRLVCDPADLIGEAHEQDGFTFIVDQEMADAARIYIDYIANTVPKDAIVYIEKYIPGAKIAMNFNGKLDYIAVRGAEAYVIDFKYGVGVMVDVDDNPQLLSYAVLLSIEFPQLEKVTLAIVQPRAQSGPMIKTIEIDRKRIDEFANQVRNAYHKAKFAQALEKKDPEDFVGNYLAAGDHCRWCAAKADCPKLNQHALTVAKQEFSTDIIETISADQLKFWLDHEKVFRDWLDAIKAKAKSMIESGDDLPGYKVVQSIGNRKWSDNDEATEKQLRSLGFKKKDLYESKIVGPAKIEKLDLPTKLSKADLKSAIEQLTVRPINGTTLVKVSDRRPALTQSTPTDDFATPVVS